MMAAASFRLVGLSALQMLEAFVCLVALSVLQLLEAFWTYLGVSVHLLGHLAVCIYFIALHCSS